MLWYCMETMTRNSWIHYNLRSIVFWNRWIRLSHYYKRVYVSCPLFTNYNTYIVMHSCPCNWFRSFRSIFLYNTRVSSCMNNQKGQGIRPCVISVYLLVWCIGGVVGPLELIHYYLPFLYLDILISSYDKLSIIYHQRIALNVPLKSCNG